MGQVRRQPRRTRRRRFRRGAVAVELAMIIPVCLTLFLGMLEVSRLYETQGQLASAIREGARLAAMDRSNLLGQGQSTNQKIIADVENLLSANGLPGDKIDVIIADPDFPNVPFNLDDPANDLKLFQVRVEVPYSALNPLCPPGLDGIAFRAKVVFRNARAVIVQ